MASESTSQTYTKLKRTLLTPINQPKVLCELMVDFKSLADNGYDFRHTIRFQGWNRYLYRLIGPVFPSLVKEFWIHAQAYPKVIISSVMGKKPMINEKLISQLIGYEHTGIVATPANRRDMKEICSEVFLSGVHSNKIKDLKHGYKIWAKIFLGCFFHRKVSNSPDYINNEQLYLLHCIGNDVLVDIPHILFTHL